MVASSNKPNADKPLYFVSYSRKHFYLAEWLTISLERAGYNLWFDVQELLPGIQWEQAIGDGLMQCVGVILVASQAALASPYVEKEWARVQDDGKRICVCVVEDVTLPDRLTRPDVTVIDMRRNFARGLQLVTHFLDGKPVDNQSHLIRSSLRFGVYWATPRLIRNSVMAWLELAALNVIAALIMLIGLLTANSRRAVIAFLPVVMCLYAARIFWRCGHRYMRRQFTIQQINIVGGGALISLIALSLGLALVGSTNDTLNAIGYSFTIMLLLYLCLMLIGVADGSNPIRYRWLPTGEASQIGRRIQIERLIAPDGFYIRRFVLAFIIPFWNLFGTLSRYVIDSMPPIIIVRKDNPHPVRFALTHDPADQYLAQRIHFTMTEYGHKPTTEVNKADYQLIIVSDTTTEDEIVAATQHPTPPVFVLAAPITLNSDSREAKYQWLDYRRRSQTQLNAMARVLRTDQDLTLRERIAYSETFLPLNFASVLVPQILAYGLLGFRLIGTALIILSALIMLFIFMNLVALKAILVSGALLISGIVLIAVEHQIYHRRTELRWAYAGVVIGFGWLIATLIFGIVLLTRTITATPPGGDTTLAAEGASFLYAALVIAFVSLLIVIAELRLWLPAPDVLRPATRIRLSEKSEQAHWHPTAINAIFLSVLICAIVYLMFQSS